MSLRAGNAARIKDQIYLPKGGLTAEQVRLRRWQPGTEYRINSSPGLSYAFGSALSSAVNTRMGM